METPTIQAFRFPDKPASEIHRRYLGEMPGCFATLKMDGWRMRVELCGPRPMLHSATGGPIPISGTLLNELTKATLHLPTGTLLDGEWLGRRPGSRTEAVWFFDLLQYGTEPLWIRPARERFELLRVLADSPQARAPLPVTPCEMDGTRLAPFFDRMRAERNADAEGIVIKRDDSVFIGGYEKSRLNRGWVKCKWRAGEDGTRPTL